LKRIITFTKKSRKKIRNQNETKTIRTKLENIIPSIWIKGWNWKLLKLLQKGKKQKNKIRNPKNKDHIREYSIIVNWDWRMKLKINKTSTKGRR
jgi:hypothetical protein